MLMFYVHSVMIIKLFDVYDLAMLHDDPYTLGREFINAISMIWHSTEINFQLGEKLCQCSQRNKVNCLKDLLFHASECAFILKQCNIMIWCALTFTSPASI